MSCSALASEFSAQKFRLVVDNPSVFGVWRHTCCRIGKCYYVYRVLFASLIFLLLSLDFLWIIGFEGAGNLGRISACLDCAQLNLIVLFFAYGLLAQSAAKFWLVLGLSPDERTIPYKFAWLLYTCSINAAYTCMIIFWASGGWKLSLEQQLKNTIPGCLILLDLCLTSVPLYFCHFIYVILFYLLYLAMAALSMFLAYTLGSADKSLPAPSDPTVLIAGYPLLPGGYSDFSNVHHIISTLFGSVSLAVIIHCILLSMVMTRDFFSSLFHVSTSNSFESEPLLPQDDPHSHRLSSQSPSTSNSIQQSDAAHTSHELGPVQSIAESGKK